MATVAKTPMFFEEVGDFLASAPTQLLHQSSQGALTREEQHEFSQFELIEMLLQYAKARIRAERKKNR